MVGDFGLHADKLTTVLKKQNRGDSLQGKTKNKCILPVC